MLDAIRGSHKNKDCASPTRGPSVVGCVETEVECGRPGLEVGLGAECAVFLMGRVKWQWLQIAVTVLSATDSTLEKG